MNKSRYRCLPPEISGRSVMTFPFNLYTLCNTLLQICSSSESDSDFVKSITYIIGLEFVDNSSCSRTSLLTLVALIK